VTGLEAAPQADRAEGDEDAADDIRDNALTGYEVYVRLLERLPGRREPPVWPDRPGGEPPMWRAAVGRCG
jgi:hypothetical protein